MAATPEEQLVKTFVEMADTVAMMQPRDVIRFSCRYQRLDLGGGGAVLGQAVVNVSRRA